LTVANLARFDRNTALATPKFKGTPIVMTLLFDFLSAFLVLSPI